MLRISKRLLSLLLALTLILSMTTVAFAKDYDLINKNTQARNDFFDLLEDIDFFADVLDNPDQYVIEVNGKYYEVEQVDAATQDGTGIDEAVVDLLPVDLDTEEELKVVSVSAINADGVDVVFAAAPEEDVDDVTIVVLDNNGNVVEVEPITVAAGETNVFFEFATHFADDYEFEGVWTVAGIEIDFDLIAKLEAFLEADEDQIALNNALTDLGIKNVKVDNIPAYAADHNSFIGSLSKDLYLERIPVDLTVEAIQAWIDKVNAEAISAEEEAAIVKAVVDAKKAGNQVALLKALQNDAFVRVNADWIADYDNELVLAAAEEKTLISEESSIKDIQGAINKVNNAKIKTEYNALKLGEEYEACVDRAELLKVKALIEAYATPTDKGEFDSTVKGYLKAIDIQLAVVDVRAANTPTRLKNALVKLDNLLDEKFMEDLYKDANAKYYLDGYGEGDDKVSGIKEADVKTVDDIIGESGVLPAINKAVEDAQDAINEKISGVEVKVANRPHPNATNGPCYLLGYEVIFELAATENGEATVANGDGAQTSYPVPKSITAEFYKGKNLLGTLKSKDPISQKIIDDITVKRNGVTSGTLDVFGDYDSDSWIGTWNAGLTDIPDKVVVKIEFKDGTAVVASDDNNDNNDKVTLALTDVTPFFVEAVNRAQTADEMSRALINLEAKMNNGKDFTNLPKADKLIVAQRVLEIRNEQEALEVEGKVIPNTAGKFFNDENKLDASYVLGDNVLGVVLLDRTTLLGAVKDAADIATMKAALEASELLPEFAELTPAEKTYAAENVLTALERLNEDGKQFKTVAEIKAAMEGKFSDIVGEPIPDTETETALEY